MKSLVIGILGVFMLLTITYKSSYANDSIKVGLVLSGGGAKGLFHIGVIQALEENNIPIDYVTGTSMGAIVAGMYSMGYTTNEMIEFFSSKRFEDILSGVIPAKYKFYSRQMDETPEILSLKFDFEKGKFKPILPTNLIQPYRMDMEFIALTSGASAACRNNFDSLMIPFRCVASDINTHKSYVMKSGNLGSAIRASMSYPFVFKPVLIDSILLLDGGAYNNFPWDVMINDFNPDIVIGSRCASNPSPPDEMDLISLISNMLMTETDYDMPDSISILIEKHFSEVGVLDFFMVKELVDSGYHTTMSQINEIKQKISARRTQEEVTAKRQAFKAKCPALMYNGAVARGAHESQNQNIVRIITNDQNVPYNHDKFEERYFSVIARDIVNVFYPTAEYNEEINMYVPNLRINPSSIFKISLGGNVSSSAGNMVYVGLEALRWRKSSTRLKLNLTFGRLYSSAQVGIRQDYPLSVPLFTEAYMTVSGYDFYRGNQNIFYDNIRPIFLKEYDNVFSANVGSGITKNSKMRAGFSSGFQNANYYKNVNYKSTDTLDKSNFPFFSTHVTIDKNTYNFKQYPTEGHYLKMSFRGVWGNERHKDASMPKEIFKQVHRWASFRVASDYLLKMNKYVSLGVYTELMLSSKFTLYDYYSTLSLTPVFQPTPHSKTFFLENYRASTYIALGLKPIFKVNRNVSLQADAYVFQPYEVLQRDLSREQVPKPMLMGSAAAVWQSPIGPLSFSVNYYEKNSNKFHFLVNFGYILFNKKGIDY